MTPPPDDPEQHIWDTGMQPERTALAWQRSGLSMLGCALALASIDKNHLHWAWLLPSLAVAGVGLWVTAQFHSRYRRLHHMLLIDDKTGLPDGRLPLLISAAVFLLGLVGVATWWSPGR